VKSAMQDEEREKYERALRMLGDLRVRANEGNMGFDEGRFLNIFGKMMEMLYQIWRTHYLVGGGMAKMKERANAMAAVAKGYVAAGERLIGKEFRP